MERHGRKPDRDGGFGKDFGAKRPTGEARKDLPVERRVVVRLPGRRKVRVRVALELLDKGAEVRGDFVGVGDLERDAVVLRDG